MKTEIIVICHNIRSVHNIGSILRTADGFGAQEVIVTGISPYPEVENDSRLPHVKLKLTEQIHKTALGAEKTVKVRYQQKLEDAITDCRAQGCQIVALEQSRQSILLNKFNPGSKKIALVLGPEVTGLSSRELELVDAEIEIPMFGKKESFNVSVAAGIALYQLAIIGS